MSDVQEVADEFNLLADESANDKVGSFYIEVEEGDDDSTAISFGHKNLSRIEVVNLLAYVYEQYVADMGTCTCGQCDEDDE